MARSFKMHRAGQARTLGGAGVAPLGSRAAAVAGRRRPADRLDAKPEAPPPAPVKEIGGPEGPEPTRYGDWERNGICYDF